MGKSKYNAEYCRRYRESHRNVIDEYQRIYREKNKHKQKEYDLRRKFNIGFEKYNEMFESQGGRCAVCDRHQSAFKLRLAVDHCHFTGKIRGLLCGSCNSGIGKLGDSVSTLNSAITYLKKYGGES